MYKTVGSIEEDFQKYVLPMILMDCRISISKLDILNSIERQYYFVLYYFVLQAYIMYKINKGHGQNVLQYQLNFMQD